MKNENTVKATISVKPEVKEKFTEHMVKINNDRHSKGKITASDWLIFIMDNMPESLRDGIKSHKMTILDEQLRARSIYEKEHGQIDDEKWEILKISGGLKTYFKKHSSISLEAH